MIHCIVFFYYASLCFRMYGSWIDKYLCNQSLSPLKLRVRIALVMRCTCHNFMFVSELRQVGRFLRVLRFPSNKTDRHDMTEIVLKVALTIIEILSLNHNVSSLKIDNHC